MTACAASGAGTVAAVAELATRLAGSADLYAHNGRRPYASINFVTAHDGFTLQDLVTYEQNHNEANGEDNRDGENHNLSWNCGVEGPTDDPAVRALRERQKRNFMATLFLSQGVPMISGGDELGRTQRGNNNAYCQDNEISWTDWTLTDERQRVPGLRPSRQSPDARASGASSSPVLSRPPHSGCRRQGHHVAGPRRPGDDGSGMARGPGAVPGGAAGR